MSPPSASLVTSPGRGGIAVIVLAGPGAGEILQRIFRPRQSTSPPPSPPLPSPLPLPGHLSLGWIVSGPAVLDEAVVTCSDNLAEINIHGGLHVARKVLSLLAEHGVRIVPDCPADPVLAVPSPAMDNPAVAREALSALRTVSTPLAASAVAAQWSGGISALAAAQEPDPIRLRAAADALPLMKRLLNPAEVVIAGPPNAGKSALANALVGRNVSIVSDRPGTTRDWVRTLCDADGVPVWLTDTAGLWTPPTPCPAEAAGDVEAEAVRRARQCIDSADLVIRVTAGDRRSCEKDEGFAASLRSLPNVLDVAGKCDITEPPAQYDLAVSAVKFTGIDALRRSIREKLGFGAFDPSAAMALTDRQAGLLRAAADSFDKGDAHGARLKLAELLGQEPAGL